MSKQDILDIFKDINYEYNDSTRFITLKNMLNEMCEDCDRVAVVRCVDCKWNMSCGYISTRSFKEWKNWFCADGERRTHDRSQDISL